MRYAFWHVATPTCEQVDGVGCQSHPWQPAE